MLTPDIVVRPHDGALEGRLALYPEGTVCYAEEARFGRQVYRAGAFLPRGNHRPASAAEVMALGDWQPARDRNHTIGIVRLPGELVGALREARVGEGQIAEETLTRFPFDRLHAAIAPGWHSDGQLLALGYGRNPAGFLTVTFDANVERFIGLHIDDLDAMPITRRAESTTRLCVNLGSSARYLLFVNLGVACMARMLAETDRDTDFEAWRSTPLIHAFLRQFPGYPVARLAVRPGEAYIAPTENMIHDGATDGMDAVDEQVTVRGVFDPA